MFTRAIMDALPLCTIPMLCLIIITGFSHVQSRSTGGRAGATRVISTTRLSATIQQWHEACNRHRHRSACATNVNTSADRSCSSVHMCAESVTGAPRSFAAAFLPPEGVGNLVPSAESARYRSNFALAFTIGDRRLLRRCVQVR